MVYCIRTWGNSQFIMAKESIPIMSDEPNGALGTPLLGLTRPQLAARLTPAWRLHRRSPKCQHGLSAARLTPTCCSARAVDGRLPTLPLRLCYGWRVGPAWFSNVGCSCCNLGRVVCIATVKVISTSPNCHQLYLVLPLLGFFSYMSDALSP